MTFERIADRTGASLDWLLLGDGGEEPVYRQQSRANAELEQDVAAYVTQRVRTQRNAEAPGSGDLPLAADGGQILERAVETASAELRAYLKAEADHLGQRVDAADAKFILQNTKEILDSAVAAGAITPKRARDSMSLTLAAHAADLRRARHDIPTRPAVYPVRAALPRGLVGLRTVDSVALSRATRLLAVLNEGTKSTHAGRRRR